MCGENLFLDSSREQCEFCPVNSVLNHGVKTGKSEDVCSCNPGFYIEKLKKSGKTSCVKCPLETQSKKGSTSLTDCKCNKGFYSQTGFTCAACPPEKSVCDVSGLSAPKTAAGWWRANLTNSNLNEFPFYKCKPGHCKGNVNGSNSSCNLGYNEKGPKCSTCAPNYYMTNGNCSYCESGVESSSVSTPLLSIMLVFMLFYLTLGW